MRPKTLGVLAVIGLVVAFSLSSTLVKRAESPGVLVAFWRLIAVSILWNAVLWGTGRSVTRADVRQVWLPGVFFGLNLAVFFAGATHNSVANAALIGSLAPFLIVPVGAWLFAEYINPRALVFAVIAFGGVVLVLLNAPPGGDASLEGNVLGVIAMLLLVAPGRRAGLARRCRAGRRSGGRSRAGGVRRRDVDGVDHRRARRGGRRGGRLALPALTAPHARPAR